MLRALKRLVQAALQLLQKARAFDVSTGYQGPVQFGGDQCRRLVVHEFDGKLYPTPIRL